MPVNHRVDGLLAADTIDRSVSIERKEGMSLLSPGGCSSCLLLTQQAAGQN